jgi:hypothetical protein
VVTASNCTTIDFSSDQYVYTDSELLGIRQPDAQRDEVRPFSSPHILKKTRKTTNPSRRNYLTLLDENLDGLVSLSTSLTHQLIVTASERTLVTSNPRLRERCLVNLPSSCTSRSGLCRMRGLLNPVLAHIDCLRGSNIFSLLEIGLTDIIGI